MPDARTPDFSRFAKDGIAPAVEAVQARKRRHLLFSLAVGLGVFVICAAAAYLYLLPYRQLMRTHGLVHWPLVVLAPLSLAMVVFSSVYILKLRGMVREFRAELIGRMAEFIHPGLAHAANRPLPREELERVPLAVLGGGPVPGPDRFSGDIDGMGVSVFDLRCDDGGKGGKNAVARTGLYFHAAFARRFAAPAAMVPADVDGDAVEARLVAQGAMEAGRVARFTDAAHGRRVFAASADPDFPGRLLSGEVLARLEALRRQRGTEFFLACQDGDLRLALLTRTERRELPGGFEGFDFGHCREFCLDAALCLEIARELAGRNDVWKREAAEA